MSGHSHWSSIKHKKGIEDQKRGKVFSKIARIISVAARKGTNPEKNSELRQALEEAKSLNVPKENIERAIKKGSGELEGEKLEEIEYEAFGPKGVTLIIEGITDNKNRTLSEIRQILQKYEGKLAETGSVKWLFEKKGTITISLESQEKTNKESLELKAIEAGAEDIYWHEAESILTIYTKPENLDKVKKTLENNNIEIESSILEWTSKEEVEISERNKEKIQNLFEELSENDAVQDIYSNLKI